MGIVTPLILAIYALLTCHAEAAQDELTSFQVNMELARVLYSAVSSSFNNRTNYGHLYVAGTLLMSQIGYPVYEKYIEKRIKEMEQNLEDSEENRKVRLRERINRI